MSGPRTYVHIAGRLFNRPLALLPARAHQIVGVLAPRLGVSALLDENGDAVHLDRGAFLDDDEPSADLKPYLVKDRVAVIPVCGALVHKFDWVAAWCGLTSYDRLIGMVEQAAADPEVDGIWLDIDSPGGEVAGLFDVADELYALSQAGGGPKPIWAMLTESAYSAAYALASQCDRIVVPRTGGCGSIGVIVMHQDESKFWDDRGIKITLLTAGEHKADGNRFEKLPKAVADRVLTEIEDVRSLFADTVARGRDVAREAVLATEAQTFPASAALDLNLVDAIASEKRTWLDFQSVVRAKA